MNVVKAQPVYPDAHTIAEQSMTTIIHVNRQLIAQNTKDGGDRPVYIVRSGRNGTSRYAREVIIHGPSRFVPFGERLRCGARAWLTTESPVELIGETSFAEIQRRGNGSH